MQQLDLFNDSRDRVLINRLAEAVEAGAAGPAALEADALRAEFPADRHLPAAAVLIATLAAEAQAGASALADFASTLAAHTHLTQQVAPAAQTLLGAACAAPWLATRWQALAHRARRLVFSDDPSHAHAHAAALWLQGAAWDEAAAAVSTVESWRRRPTPLAWMAQARWHLEGLDATWPLLAELAWMAPARVPLLLRLLPDAACAKLARRFESDFDGVGAGPGGWAWWPAWLLIEQPLLAEPLSHAQTAGEDGPELAFKLVRSLLHLERHGRHHELIAHRRQLQSLNPALFAAYMATR